MIEVSFQGETHHCFANNPQSDTGSDTQDTNTMTSAAAGSRQQHGGSTEQWENVPACSVEQPNTSTTPAQTHTQHRCGTQTQILYGKKKTSLIKLAAFKIKKTLCMHNISLLE